MQKFVLCRPQGGLNDILNQIEHCCAYAETHGRLAIIDTAYRHSTHFKDRLSKYFVSLGKPVVLDNPFPDEVLDTLDVFPHFLKGRLSNYKAQGASNVYIDRVTGHRLGFDYQRDYPERILLHHQLGGGLDSLNFFKRVLLSPGLTGMLEQRILGIGGPFAAIHIRHTDVRTRYQGVIENIRKREFPRLFVASDNVRVIADFRAGLPDTEVISFASLPDVGGRALHINPPPEEAETRNTDAILDVLTLALAKPLLAAQTVNSFEHEYSGFTRLAAGLHQSPMILRSLLRVSASLQAHVAQVLS